MPRRVSSDQKLISFNPSQLASQERTTMDPQACFERILDAIENQDADEFTGAFEDLANWLQRGGFPPVVRSLGEARYAVGPSHNWQFETRPRKVLSCVPFDRPYTIRSVDPQAENPDRFEFVIFDGAHNKPLAVYKLA
jgi:hypothetical protein